MRVLAMAGDAGGAAALLPVIRRLREAGTTVTCLAYAAATDVWCAAGLEPLPAGRLDVRGVDGLLLGTTVGPERRELQAILDARDAGVPSVSLVDFWSHYRERFTAADGGLVLPDAVAVPDARARDEMTAEGFPGERLHVTGHPAFEDLARYDGDAARRRACRRTRDLGQVADDERCVLYASQPLSQLGTRATYGFDERDVLPPLVEALGRVVSSRARRARLVVRPHPRESGRPFDAPLSPSPGLAVTVVDAADVDVRELVLGSDVVVGMNSALLVEACLLGTPVVSYQPGLSRTDPLVTNRHGWSRAVYRRADLERALDEELFDHAVRDERRRRLETAVLPRGATERVIALLRRMAAPLPTRRG